MNDNRITELEIRFSHQDDFLRQLNEVVVDQQQKIDRLEKEILDLKRNINQESGVDGGRSLSDEKPPHY
jgi:SlyX protein